MTPISTTACDNEPIDAHERVETPLVVAFDLDGTIVPQDSQTVAAWAMVKRGLLPWSTVIDAQIWLMGAWLGLHTANAADLQAKAVAHLAGASESALRDMCAEIVQRKLLPSVRSDARAAIDAWRARGAWLVLASASLEPLVEPMAAALGFDAYVATRLAPSVQGKVDGRLAGPRLSGDAKRDAVITLADAHFESWRLAAAYGDHASDASLLAFAERPVAVSPTAELRRLAAKTNWPIERWV